MKISRNLLQLMAVATILLHFAAADVAAGGGVVNDTMECLPKLIKKKSIGNCPLYSEPSPARKFGLNGRIIDISHQIRAGLPNYGAKGLTSPDYLKYWSVFENDTDFKTQFIGFQMPAHMSTHCDAPSHAIPENEKACRGADTIDLDIMMGPALVVEVPKDTNITAEALQQLAIPRGVKRVLFKTLNTDLNLMWKEFESNYTGVTEDGAQWLVDNTDVKLVGIDYLSIAIGSHKEQYVPPHKVLLKNNVTPVENLNLGGVAPGEYELICLPIRLLGADGAPTRCVLITKE